MKTVVIWDDCQGALTFYVLNGDFTHLNNVYVNQVGDEEDEKRQEQVNELLTDVEKLSTFPIEEVKNGAIVIVCGFLP